MTNKQPHSANVLNDIRDYWYSPDFLDLMAKRWKLAEVKTMLDVGCGMGHWGQLLAPFLSSDMHMTGIDPEKIWIEKAIERAQKKGLTSRTTYQMGTAETIPFPDHYFDMVTCQTVLIHVKDVSVALKEMLRVLKPGGLIAVAEPNNLISRLVFNNLTFNEPINNIIDSIRFELICERGKEKLHKGNSSRGDIIPYAFYKADIKNIQVYLADLADYFIPPYDSPRERISLSGLNEDSQKEWDNMKQEMQEFFLAGDGLPSEFEMYWDKILKNKDQIIAGYKDKTLCAAGGLIMYLISGRKE